MTVGRKFFLSAFSLLSFTFLTNSAVVAEWNGDIVEVAPAAPGSFTASRWENVWSYNPTPAGAEAAIHAGADVHEVDEYKFTPLHWACKGQFWKVVPVLIENGANVTAITDFGDTPLHYAVNIGHLDTARILLDAPGGTAIINHRNNHDMRPIDEARKCGRSDLVELLLSYGAAA